MVGMYDIIDGLSSDVVILRSLAEIILLVVWCLEILYH